MHFGVVQCMILNTSWTKEKLKSLFTKRDLDCTRVEFNLE